MKSRFNLLPGLLMGLLMLPLTSFAANERIVSAGAGVTELLHLLDADDQMVAVDVTSNWPADVRKLPKIGYHRALSSEGILALQPTMVIGTEEMGPPIVIKQLREAGVKVEVLSADPSEKAMHERLQQVGALVGKEAQAEKVWQQFVSREEQLQERAAEVKKPLRVLFLVTPAGNSPLVAGDDTSADLLINMAGGINAAADLTKAYRSLSAEAILAAQPDVILVPGQMLKTMGGIDAVIKSQPGLKHTPAGQNRRVIEVDGGVLVAGTGPRIVDVAAKLANELYPNQPLQLSELATAKK